MRVVAAVPVAADRGAPPSPVEITRALARIGTVHVMVVGDVMLDRFVYGDVSRVSYEAPIPVLNVARESAMPGGAGNAARNAAALGARVSLVGVVGDDAAGAELREIVAGIAGLSDRLIVEAGRPTTRKTRFVAQGQQLQGAWLHPAVEERCGLGFTGCELTSNLR